MTAYCSIIKHLNWKPVKWKEMIHGNSPTVNRKHYHNTTSREPWPEIRLKIFFYLSCGGMRLEMFLHEWSPGQLAFHHPWRPPWSSEVEVSTDSKLAEQKSSQHLHLFYLVLLLIIICWNKKDSRTAQNIIILRYNDDKCAIAT